MEKGIIFDSKEFAVFDGPGMRQTIFLKGCPLRCSWCHNPEGLSAKPELMVSRASCIHCGKCGEACALTKENGSNEESRSNEENGSNEESRSNEKNGFNEESGADDNCIISGCDACGRCIPVCPLRLRHISGTYITSKELSDKIRRDSDYYARYGGGVTFSGGEPLMQAAFLLEVLKEIKDLHRAVETSGYCFGPIFERVLHQVDYVMMDIKIFDSEKHKKYTGVDNQLILQNAKILCRDDVPFVIRIPVIPGVNDGEDNYRNIAEWIAGAGSLQKVELLPYHKTAGAKYGMIGKEYCPGFDTKQSVRISQKVFNEYGIRSEIL